MRYGNYTNEALADELSKIATDLEKKKLNDKAQLVRFSARRLLEQYSSNELREID